MATLGQTPGRELVRQWLKAGYVEEEVWNATDAGTPQGGVISPLLANIALHGMEKALGVKYARKKTGNQLAGPRAVVRYADDFVVFCETQEDAQAAVVTLSDWLAERGLTLSTDKTRIVHLEDGFDFLGFNIRHYPSAKAKSGYKLLIKPSDESAKRIRARLRQEWLSLIGSNAIAVCRRLNPIIRGWANYFRVGVSSRTFSELQHWMFLRERRFAKRTHPTKSWKWRKNRYWGRMNPQRGDNWVFGDKRTGVYLLKFNWFPIRRHTLVKGTNSPDDPTLDEYWAKRRLAKLERLSPGRQKLARKQRGLCTRCGQPILDGEPILGTEEGEEVHVHHRVPEYQGAAAATTTWR
jgi:RNA-directed DNA polymerase